MAAQAALIADTIVGMKRALRKENDYSGPDDPITQPTNRGNKMRANAKYVREGALGYIHPEELFKQKIEHAGYTRYILQPNPVRYDSEGDELDEDDEHSEADAAAAEENPFSEIALENFMCPLKHPSELPVHPSLSHAYKSKALFNMAQAIEDKLRQERVLLWRARNLHRQFLGDEPWMPCGAVETDQDRRIFEPRWPHIGSTSPRSQYEQNREASKLVTEGPNASENGIQETKSVADSEREPRPAQQEGRLAAEKDVNMTDASNDNTVLANHDTVELEKAPKSEEVDTPVADLLSHREIGDSAPQNSDTMMENPHFAQDKVPEPDQTVGGDAKEEANGERGVENAGAEHPISAQGDEMDLDGEAQDGSPLEPPRRMTTRAQANAVNPHQENGSPSPSSDTLNSLPTPHPLFLVPDSIRPDPNFGLPPNEAEETRRLLWSYVQKQEETVRGFEHMLNSLLRASRMKEDVYEWCKAEGHVGEMSDGEDWYDREALGLGEDEDLKKGADEDEIETVEESRAANKRGRRRA
ncbi:hypothetical protein P168DRAFT_330220 [Aspergillus campestris IBT 28561]|uniref:Transcriptional regulatory protein RXT2 N-terminal domain-containing protein n=1 Tax=Aspergillus campestris (strain IBT 28561) TaxID=1392248 RepID=A0A2I1CTH9_ASPC2|nr:uncharacterized protein P168DRAFT_330220 [Aspergillus campestris IBT 28561]PKY00928.1 hypothetical protein P168DRAFT_330220 [Aspergillus campestris IBT 28561]